CPGTPPGARRWPSTGDVREGGPPLGASPAVGHHGVDTTLAELLVRGESAVPPRRIPQVARERPHNRSGVVQPPGRPRDADDDPRHADRHLAGRALSLRSLPGVPPGRCAAAGTLPPTTARPAQRGPP